MKLRKQLWSLARLTLPALGFILTSGGVYLASLQNPYHQLLTVIPVYAMIALGFVCMISGLFWSMCHSMKSKMYQREAPRTQMHIFTLDRPCSFPPSYEESQGNQHSHPTPMGPTLMGPTPTPMDSTPTPLGCTLMGPTPMGRTPTPMDPTPMGPTPTPMDSTPTPMGSTPMGPSPMGPSPLGVSSEVMLIMAPPLYSPDSSEAPDCRWSWEHPPRYSQVEP